MAALTLADCIGNTPLVRLSRLPGLGNNTLLTRITSTGEQNGAGGIARTHAEVVLEGAKDGVILAGQSFHCSPGTWLGSFDSNGAALLSGNRNVGLMLVATAGTAGEAFSLYTGIAQIPMYFAPLVLTPFLRRSRRAA